MSPKQRAFAQSYARNQNVYQSAKEAGYSDTYARTAAKILLGNAEIAAEIKRIRERLNQTADKSAVDVVNEFSKIAFTDRVDFLKEDPHIPGDFIYKAPDELTREQRAIVEKVTYNVREIVIISTEKDVGPETIWRQEYNYILSDKAKALENMGRHFGIFDDKLRLGVSQANPFTNATQAQMEKLKESWVKTMNDPKLIEADYEVVNSDKK